jgi:hypothetical protein
MASVLKVDTVTGVTTAGSIAVTGEGNSTTTNLQQGLTKVWWQFDPTNSNTTDESFNVSGIVDNGTGDTTTSFTNAFSGARDYSTAQCHAYTNGAVGATIRGNGGILRAAGSLRSYCVWVSSTSGGATVEDDDENSWQLCGDLA